MIVSHQHKFLFVAIPKTATHAVRAALRPHLGPYDWEQCILFEEKRFPVEALARLAHGHLTCRQVQPFLLPDMWQHYCKFCFVRHPYTRFISLCTFLNRDQPRMRRQPTETMKRMIQDADFRGRLLARPQAEFVCDEHGDVLMNFIGRFESMQHDFDRIAELLGLQPQWLPSRNTSSYRVSLNSLDDELIELIQHYYRVDFRLFHYATDLGRSNPRA